MQRLSAAKPSSPGPAPASAQKGRPQPAQFPPATTATPAVRPVQLSRLPAPIPAAPSPAAAPPAPPRFPQVAAAASGGAPPTPPRPPVWAAAGSARPSVQRAATPMPPQSAPTAPAASAAEPPPHLDELAKKRVGPLSRLLRAELRLDRERIGRLRDPGR